ncbi:MAG: hypothetical protein Q8L08_01530 [Candidatus Nanopelagicaceae bacterium]|nr:hypothetical protein [Candidatus Nanopelagicaceae bacterium]
MKLLASLAWGIVLGAAAVLLHDAYVPLGLIIALLGSSIGVWLVGRMWGRRRYKVAAVVAWLILVLRAGSLGAGNELLVQGNITGNALVVGGFLVLLAVASLRS